MIARLRSQVGVTITEMVVSMTLIATVAAVFLPILGTATRSVRPMQAQSEAIDDLRNSLATIGRELRSALCVAEPAANAGSGNVLRFTTEANNEQYEVTYTVADGQLIRHGPTRVSSRWSASGSGRRGRRLHLHRNPPPDGEGPVHLPARPVPAGARPVHGHGREERLPQR